MIARFVALFLALVFTGTCFPARPFVTLRASFAAGAFLAFAALLTAPARAAGTFLAVTFLIAAAAAAGAAGLLAFGSGKVVSSILFQVSALDPFAFAVAPIILAAAALLATWLPTRRALRVNPIEALRTE